MTEQKKEQLKVEAPKMRQIIIETDGNNISITKADMAGKLELIAILGTLLNDLNKPKS